MALVRGVGVKVSVLWVKFATSIERCCLIDFAFAGVLAAGQGTR